MEEIEKWLALTFVTNLGPRRIAAVYREFGGIEAFFSGSSAELAEKLGLKPTTVAAMQSALDPKKGQRALSQCRERGVGVICPESPEYPALLKECHDPPPVLYFLGKLPQGELLAVVGSRRATDYGRRTARSLVPTLSRGGLGIVSGLAQGIDSFAHRACLESGGYTLAVLGNGVDIFYPYANMQLQKDILAGGGCILSEFPPGTKPRPDHFPRRNRIISGLCRGVLIIEAGLKSGAMITVGFALEQGRDVFAAPGNIDSPQSAGTNDLIRQGAKPALTAADILEEYNLDLPLVTAVGSEAAATGGEQEILALLDGQGVCLDEICFRLGLASSVALARLVALELKGLVARLPGQKYMLCKQRGVKNEASDCRIAGKGQDNQ